MPLHFRILSLFFLRTWLSYPICGGDPPEARHPRLLKKESRGGWKRQQRRVRFRSGLRPFDSRPLRRRVAPALNFSSFASAAPLLAESLSFLGKKNSPGGSRVPQKYPPNNIFFSASAPSCSPPPCQVSNRRSLRSGTLCSLTPRSVDLRCRGDGGAGAAAAARGSSLHTSYFTQACGLFLSLAPCTDHLKSGQGN